MREAAQDISCVPVPWEPGAQACGPPEPQVPGMSPEQQPQRQPLEMDKLGHPDACRSSLLGDSDTLCVPEGSTKVAHSERRQCPETESSGYGKPKRDKGGSRNRRRKDGMWVLGAGGGTDRQ